MFWVIFSTVLFGYVGVVIATFLFPVSHDKLLEVLFACFCFVLALYILLWELHCPVPGVGLVGSRAVPQERKVINKSATTFAVLALAGLLGGMLVGYLGNSPGVCLFFFF